MSEPQKERRRLPLKRVEYFGRRQAGIREGEGPSHLEASLPVGRHLSKVPLGFVSCFAYLLLT